MFVVYVVVLEAPEMTIHPSQIALIIDGYFVQVTALKQNEAPIKVPIEYSDFGDVFSAEETLLLPERTELNKYTIELEDNKQPPY